MGGGINPEPVVQNDLRTTISAPVNTHGHGQPNAWRLSLYNAEGISTKLDTVVVCAK